METKFVDVRTENPLIALKKLHQGDQSESEYEKKFDELVGEEVNVGEEVAINMFVGVYTRIFRG